MCLYALEKWAALYNSKSFILSLGPSHRLFFIYIVLQPLKVLHTQQQYTNNKHTLTAQVHRTSTIKHWVSLWILAHYECEFTIIIMIIIKYTILMIN